MSSYDRNIERLRAGERANVQQGNTQRTNMANTMGTRGINEAKKLAAELEDLSPTLKKLRDEQVKRNLERGRLDAVRQSNVDAKKLKELEIEIAGLKEIDTRYHEIKEEMLKLSGPDIYPEADRIAHLSPLEQVGYMNEKLRVFKETYPDKLDHVMANSEKAVRIQNMTFTPKQLHDNNIHGLPFKEAALVEMSDDIMKNAGLDKFSPEMLEYAGVNETIQKAKEDNLAKYRKRFNVEASSNTRSKAELSWKTGPKSGEDIHNFLVKTGATMDKDNNQLGYPGAWTALESLLVSEGVNGYDDEYAIKILNQPMPDALAKKLGVPKGTTYAQQWPNKGVALQLRIQQGIKKSLDAENDWLKTAGTKKENEFIKEVRENGMTEQRANEYKAWYGEFGLPIPNDIKNWESRRDIGVRESEQQIEAILGYNKGRITHAELDQFHPEAALPYREKADRFEKAALTDFGAEKKIKAVLDNTFADMGIKANEKSLAYIEANENAKADFLAKRNRLIGMGYDAKTADHLALYAQMGEIQDAEGNPIPGEIGVITEIEAKKMGSKYATFGFQVENSIGTDRRNVRQINLGKKEILEDRNVLTSKVIGGNYGEKQLASIKNNLEKYGMKGLYRDRNALNYYRGLARGRDETWPSIVDAQLKVAGHEGLWPQGKPALFTLLTGKDNEGNNLPDADGAVNLNVSAARAFNYPSESSTTYGSLLLMDSIGYKALPSSVWDYKLHIDPAIGGF